MNSVSLAKLNNLNFLKFVAIIFVALFHLNVDLCPKGFLFVEYFFIGSGFLLYYSFLKNNNLIDYIKKRFVRLYPAYIASNLLMIALYRYYGQDVNIEKIIHTFVFTSYSFIPNTPPVIGWFVPALFWGSVFVFILLKICFKFNINISLLLINSLLLYVYILICTHSLSGRSLMVMGYLLKGTLCSIAGISLGCYICIVSLKYKDAINKFILQIIEVFAILLLVVNITNKDTVYSSIFVVLSFAMLIFCFCANKTLISRFINNKYCGSLGNIVFSIYLSHTIVIKYLKFLTHSNILSFNNLQILMFLFVITIIGFFYYLIFEKGFSRYVLSYFAGKIDRRWDVKI